MDNEKGSFKKPITITSSSSSSLTFHGKKRKRKVLSEEKYLSFLGSILRKSYFPELEKLKMQSLCLDKVDINDKEKLERILSFDSSSSSLNISNMTLEQFQSLYTSEDNHSYESLIDNINKIRRDRRGRFFKNQYLTSTDSNNQMLFLTLPQSSLPSSTLPSISVAVDQRRNKSRNGINPDISLSNTRFKKPLSSSSHSQTDYENNEIDRFSELERMASRSDDNLSIGNGITVKGETDGKREGNHNNNSSSNNNFVPTTPIINPNDPENKIITWGYLESTPTRLNTDTSNQSLSRHNHPSPSHSILSSSSSHSSFYSSIIDDDDDGSKRKMLKKLLKKKQNNGTGSFDINIGGKSMKDKITTPLIIKSGGDYNKQGHHRHDHTPKRPLPSSSNKKNK